MATKNTINTKGIGSGICREPVRLGFGVSRVFRGQSVFEIRSSEPVTSRGPSSVFLRGSSQPSRLKGSAAPALSRSKGFTLVELLIGSALSTAVLAAVLSSYIYLGRGLGRLANQQTLETESRRALGYFTQDVQTASGLVTITTAPTSPSASRVDLLVPAANGTRTITYYYNSTAISGATVSDNVTINGSTIAMRREALTRCVDDGSTVTSLTLLRNITTGGLTLSYYDARGNPYTTYSDYLPGIKQLALQFSTQLGTAGSGTRTPVQTITSARLILRNRGLLQ
jgi:type II secretory pathway pseudopilin PulG